MRKLALALLLVMLLAGSARGMGDKREVREYHPRDRVYVIEEKPSQHKWWQWRKSDRRDDRKREKEWEKDRKKGEKEREKEWERWEKEREKDRKRDR